MFRCVSTLCQTKKEKVSQKLTCPSEHTQHLRLLQKDFRLFQSASFELLNMVSVDFFLDDQFEFWNSFCKFTWCGTQLWLWQLMDVAVQGVSLNRCFAKSRSRVLIITNNCQGSPAVRWFTPQYLRTCRGNTKHCFRFVLWTKESWSWFVTWWS